jgi:Uma2 family endonuclease
LHDYFKASAQLVWYLDPQRREMAVYTGPTELRVVAESDTLDGGPLLPGFQLPLAELFRVPQVG